jgi:multidrug efflux pump subunit AcrB
LEQAALVTGLIPLSFIGLFFVFVVFKVNFDQGGYAAFLLLSGQVVISALFILNEFNYSVRKYQKPPLKAYLRAYHHKIIPIALTIISTVVSFIPFLWGDKQEGFWFSMGVGTSGGLLFSLVILPFYLPLFLGIKTNWKKETKHQTIPNTITTRERIFVFKKRFRSFFESK